MVLEAEEGVLVLRSLPDDAEVQLNGQRVRPTPAPDGTASLRLAPGNYRVSVARGSSGRFEGVVDILDRSTVNLDVTLRPALVLLGILGRDDVAAERLGDEIGDAFRRADTWVVLDRTDDSRPELAGLGLTAEALRQAAQPGAAVEVDWNAVQEWADRRFQGSAYLLGVLTDDLIASEADLWIFSATPGPSRPERRRVEVASRTAVPELATAFQPQLSLERASLGADLFDSELAAGAVIASVTEGGAAARAGLLPGDVITSFAGIEDPTAQAISQRLASLPRDEAVSLRIERSGDTLSLTPDRSHVMIDFTDPDLVYPAMFASLNAELERRSDWPRWLLQLNQAALLLRAGDAEESIRTVRKIDLASVPSRAPAGLGRSAADYLLGLALSQAGPRYLETAREAFARAAQSADERLFHDDGPRVAPRANARLARLGGAPQ
ncbi:MAG: PDZ domain-containing protein [Acidobacteria bacterium]|nr:MAG: PDZ domain-containing protein [Acidobacteriota bacterium]REK08918.1 MAG: PDZ domain-containing protein [Acidobacteriota bacterium]